MLLQTPFQHHNNNAIFLFFNHLFKLKEVTFEQTKDPLDVEDNYKPGQGVVLADFGTIGMLSECPGSSTMDFPLYLPFSKIFQQQFPSAETFRLEGELWKYGKASYQ